MAGLVRVIYSSLVTEAGLAQGDRLLPEILTASVRNNGRVGVSGMLLAFGDGFLQALEGGPSDVDAVLKRVVVDPRHHSVRLIDRRSITSREFGPWAMCGRDLSATDNAIVEVLALKPGLKLRTLSGSEALKLLKAVKSIQLRTLEVA